MHTPGPLEIQNGFNIFASCNCDGKRARNGDAYQLADCNLSHWENTTELEDGGESYLSTIECQDNTKLFKAAFESYDRHCGSKSIELAEGDLLGEAIAALRRISQLDYSSAATNCAATQAVLEATAILSKIPE